MYFYCFITKYKVISLLYFLIHFKHLSNYLCMFPHYRIFRWKSWIKCSIQYVFHKDRGTFFVVEMSASCLHRTTAQWKHFSLQASPSPTPHRTLLSVQAYQQPSLLFLLLALVLQIGEHLGEEVWVSVDLQHLATHSVDDIQTAIPEGLLLSLH